MYAVMKDIAKILAMVICIFTAVGIVMPPVMWALNRWWSVWQ